MGRVLVACEFSGVVRDAFIRRGHDAMSCDLLPTESEGPHYCGDVRDVMDDGWDLVIGHPPCTYLAASGAAWWRGREREQVQLASCKSDRVAIENPVGALTKAWRRPDQYVHPWQYGHGETKKTGLWLKNLPRLNPTSVVRGRVPRLNRLGSSKNRAKNRSVTYLGIAEAMSWQWGRELGTT